ncbi:MAG TPA: hypothetical protein VFN57_13485, partial [Thermomicrobiaceae bacterium]|nr:hypothetical protein [Thermomicrobiaceae bacterium]
MDHAALAGWADVSPRELHLLELADDELHEDVGGSRVARAAAGAGLRVRGPQQSRYDLVADTRGLLRVDQARLRALNRIADVTLYTRLDREPVEADSVVASVKVSPIAIPEARVAAVEDICRAADAALLEVVPFHSKRVAALTTEPLGPADEASLRAAIERKLAWYGASLTDLRLVAPGVDRVVAAFQTVLQAGNELVLVAGGNPIDPLDPVEQALPSVGARLAHRGAPMRGSMGWLAYAGAVPILNLTASRMYRGTSMADVLLPMLMADQPVTAEEVGDLGYGGFPGSAI